MSDGQSKKFTKATDMFLSRVAERTRSKREAYDKTCFGRARRVSSVPQASRAVSSVPQALREVRSVPQASRKLSPVPQASRGLSPIPQASRGLSPIPQASCAVSSVPKASRGVSSVPRASRAVSSVPKASRGVPQASRPVSAPTAPRKRKVATGRGSRRSKQHSDDDDDDDRYGYFTPPEDVSQDSNQGSDSEDKVKIITKAEFKKIKARAMSKKPDFVVRDVSPEDLGESSYGGGESDSDEPSSFAETAESESRLKRPRFVSNKGLRIKQEPNKRPTPTTHARKNVTSLSGGSLILSISSDDSSTHSDYEIDSRAADRTPSRTGITEIPSGVKDVSPGSSYDSKSSSTDNDSDDEDFEVGDGVRKPDEIESGCSIFEVPAAKSDKLEESASKIDKLKGSASKRTTVSKPPSEETTPRKRRLSHGVLSKQTKGRKNQKTHEVCEEMNTSPSDEKGENLTESTLSKNVCAQKKCDEAQGVHHKEQPQHVHIESQEKADSPSLSTHESDGVHDDDDDDDDIVGKTYVDGETKEPMTSKPHSQPKYDLCRRLADSVLGRGSMFGTKRSDEEKEEETKPRPAAQTQSMFPSKFGFDDEVTKPVEKTEAEKEIEGLFTELGFAWTAQEDLGSFTCPEVDPENENSDDETICERCARGKHELVCRDDQGIVCIYCHHVEIGPKDVIPQWVEKTCREYGRKRSSEMEQSLEFDKLHLRPSNDNHEDSSSFADGTVWSIKPGIRESMYEHQQEGFEFLWKNLAGSINLNELKSTTPSEVGGCIISHAPGTGKTRLTIVFIETYMKLFPNCLPMIIAPAGMLLTWEEEFKKWNVDFRFLNLNNKEISDKGMALGHLTGVGRGNMKTTRMLNLYSWSQGKTVLGISYCLFEKLTGEKLLKETGNKEKRLNLDSGAIDMRKILLEKPGLVILDEGHTPRNQKSNIWNALVKLQTEKRVILSGTPFQNNLSELSNTLRIVRPVIAESLEQDKTFSEMLTAWRKHKVGHSHSNSLSEVDDRALEKLKIAMLPFVHVHKGTILQHNLPGLRDCAVLLKPPALQKSLIERFEGIPSTFEFEHKSALLSVHPYLFQHSETTYEEMIGIDLAALEASKLNPNEGVKTKFILEFIRLCMAMNEKVLVFSQYIQPLELIKEQLKEVFKWAEGNEILRMQGKLDQRQRQIMINHFNDPLNMSKVMLASTRCCSEGISLVGASRVILLDVVWNPSVERQAICRAYRIGQKKFVYTYHLMTLGTTEADKYCRQAEKERLSELVFTSSSNEINKQTLPCVGIEDKILGAMVDHPSLKEMFEKIINQPKDTNLIQSFGITS